MEIEIAAEAKDKRLNQAVAITVVVLSVFMGLAQVKDGNIVQGMQQAQADAVDRWGEYQATKTKLHIDETALAQLNLLSAAATPAAAVERARLTGEIAKYDKEIPALRTQAEGFQAQYDALNVHDDQFDASDALISIAISISAVAALAESAGTLYAAWLFGAGGIVMGLAGFLGWALHSPLAQFLS
ncbi:DUF4337 domain-containing protein [Phenylobacterium sp. LjRoot225]|uniref:DUF4337 domain-containing protein n=1 Tax=Phenylobacterium sp. LjRoot225 TaxID=3342285 RepID=UPI003ECE792A